MNHSEAVIQVRRAATQLSNLDDRGGDVHTLSLTLLNQCEKKAKEEEEAVESLIEKARASQAKAKAFRSMHAIVFNALNTQVTRLEQEAEKEREKAKELAEEPVTKKKTRTKRVKQN